MNSFHSILVACDVFKDEIEAFNSRNLSVQDLKMSLHDNPLALKSQLQQKYDELEKMRN